MLYYYFDKLRGKAQVKNYQKHSIAVNFLNLQGDTFDAIMNNNQVKFILAIEARALQTRDNFV